MPFVPFPGTAQVEIVYLLDNQVVENTLGFEAVAPPSLVELTALVEALNEYTRESLLPFLSQAIELVRLVGTLLNVPDGLQYISTTSLPLAGGITASPNLPNSLAACVSFGTAQRGRSARGRNYVAGLTEAQVTNNALAPEIRSALQTWYGGLIGNSVVPEGWTWVVLSSVSNGAERDIGQTSPITSVSFRDNFVSNQRRRRPGRGS